MIEDWLPAMTVAVLALAFAGAIYFWRRLQGEIDDARREGRADGRDEGYQEAMLRIDAAQKELEERSLPSDYRTARRFLRQECAYCGRTCPHCKRLEPGTGDPYFIYSSIPDEPPEPPRGSQ